MKKEHLSRFGTLVLLAISCNLFNPGLPASPTLRSPDAPEPTSLSETPQPGDSPGEEASVLPEELPEQGAARLNEVRFAPESDEHAFVEIKNGGRTAIPVAGLLLENDEGEIVPLPDPGRNLEPLETLTVRFDGQEGAAGASWSSPKLAFLDPDAGRLSLKDSDGTLLDWVAWGTGQPGAVKLGHGGVLSEPTPGFSIGRPPFSFWVSPQEWVLYPADETTPGSDNPLRPVTILLPLSGAVIDGDQVPLSWYPVQGAVSYELQVAFDRDFSDLAHSLRVELPPVLLRNTIPGTYFWRVRAITLGGHQSSFSVPNTVSLEMPAAAGSGMLSLMPIAQDESTVILNVPLLEQHKDTNMILLEHPQDRGAHAWNAAHPGLKIDDPADNANCALASTAMVNHFYGGDLSQDRIGFEIFRSRLPGPEEDLNYNYGLLDPQITQALGFALGAAPDMRRDPDITNNPSGAYRQMWNDVRAQIDLGKPVVGSYLYSNGGHAFVFVGYSEKPEGDFYVINDPWGAVRYTVPVTVTAALNFVNGGRWDTYWVLPNAVTPTMDDPELSMNSDSDDVFDFDEIHRFMTNPNHNDSDHDEIDDFTEIWTTGFDPNYGYALKGLVQGRDYDLDGTDNELDVDSDDGGCWDGLEDRNQDGEHQSEDETYNYDLLDDLCFVVDGTWTFNDSWGNTAIEIQGSFIVNEENKIDGIGLLNFSHSGPCTKSTQTGPIEFAGEAEDNTLKLTIIDTAEDEALDTDVSADLPAGCTIGDALGETYAATFGPFAAMPAVITIEMNPEEEYTTVELKTPSLLADREPGDLSLTIFPLESIE